MQEAKKVGDEFLALEKYVNLNYLVHLILGFWSVAAFHCKNPRTSLADLKFELRERRRGQSR